jgi:hypothetical protein
VITRWESYFIAQRMTARWLGFASHNKGQKSTGQKKKFEKGEERNHAKILSSK